MSMAGFPDLSLHLSKQSTAVSGGGPMQTSMDIPFSFDHSGFVFAPGNTGRISATGSTGQGSGAGGGLGASLGGALAGLNPNMIALGVVAYLLLKRKN